MLEFLNLKFDDEVCQLSVQYFRAKRAVLGRSYTLYGQIVQLRDRGARESLSSFLGGDRCEVSGEF